MPRRQKITETQKLVMRASYDKYFITFGSMQKAFEKVAEEFGIHWQTARTIIKATRGVDKALIADVKKHQASKIDKIVNKILEDLDTSKKEFKGMSAAQSVLAAAQLIDKSMKLKGEDIVKLEINEMGAKLEDKLKQLQNLKEALQKSIQVPEEPKSN